MKWQNLYIFMFEKRVKFDEKLETRQKSPLWKTLHSRFMIVINARYIFLAPMSPLEIFSLCSQMLLQWLGRCAKYSQVQKIKPIFLIDSRNHWGNSGLHTINKDKADWFSVISIERTNIILKCWKISIIWMTRFHTYTLNFYNFAIFRNLILDFPRADCERPCFDQLNAHI